MSAMLDDIVTRNLHNLRLDDAPFAQLKVPGARTNRSASFFFSSPHSGCSSSARQSLSTEHVNYSNADDDDDDNNDDFAGDSFAWSANIWSQLPKQQPPFSFRPDRSMSLTESSCSLLPFSQLKGLEGFSSSSSSCSSSSGTTVAPPPGFSGAPAGVQAPLTPTLLPSNRYKTELCRGFQESGACKYGAKCQFAHGEAELRGLHRHPKYKTEPCRTFYNFGYCPYGPRCHFIHGERPAASAALAPAHNNPRPSLRQSVSFAGFLGSSRSSPPPSLPGSFTDLQLGFSRAPSVSPPPANDHPLSPVFGDAPHASSAASFLFSGAPAAAGPLPSSLSLRQRQQHQRPGLPLIAEPEAPLSSCCMCGGHGGGKPGGPVAEEEEEEEEQQVVVVVGAGRQGGAGGAKPSALLQRFSSEDSLEESYSSSSSAGSSGAESPTFDGSATKRLTVFARLSLSD